MANRPTAPPNSAGMECYPGTDMTGVEMELLRELMRKAERNKMMTQTLSLNQLEHKHAPDPRQAEWNAQKAAGQWPGWKAAGPPPKSVNPPPASSGRPPNMNFDPNDDPWAAETAVPKADPPILQIFGNVQQGTPPINLPPAATAMGKCGFPEHSAAAMGTESTFPPAKAAAPTAENSAARQLPIPKASGPNKAARNSTPKIEEVPEEEIGDGNGGWMKALRGIEMFLRMKMNSLALNIFQPADVSPPWFPNHLWGIPSTIQQNSSDWNDKNWYPSYNSDDMDPAVPYPVHVQGIKSWASTKIKLKKWRNKELSYHEFITKVFNHDDEAGQYAKWILAHYTSKITAAPKSQVPDLAAFLNKMRGCVFGCNNSISSGVDECGLRQEALTWCFHVHADNFCMTMQR